MNLSWTVDYSTQSQTYEPRAEHTELVDFIIREWSYLRIKHAKTMAGWTKSLGKILVAILFSQPAK